MTSTAQYRKWIEQGMCGNCGRRPRADGRSTCVLCRERNRLYSRARAGCSPWKPGSPGRIPVEHIPDRLRAERDILQARIREIDRLLGGGDTNPD